MKKFLIWIICVFAGSLLVVVMANLAYTKLKTTPVDTEAYKNIPDSIKVCNLGSSHGVYSFEYDAYSDKITCFNFALTSQRYQYDYRILQNYIDKIDEGAVVFIPFSYFSIWGEKDEDMPDFESRNRRYYRILPPKYIVKYDLWTDVCEHYLPILSAYDDVLDVIKDSIVGDGSGTRFDDTEIDMYEDAKFQYKQQILDLQDETGKRILNEDRIDALYKLIDLCKEKGLHPVLITTPLTDVFVDYVEENTPGFNEEFHNEGVDIANRAGIEYYDYSSDQRISDNLEYFEDSHHLNKKGGEYFTSIVMDEIVSKYFDIY